VVEHLPSKPEYEPQYCNHTHTHTHLKDPVVWKLIFEYLNRNF
jgi:hypothetical protein